MKISLTRYYGDSTVTKSHLRAETSYGEVFECEARETQFKSYTDTFAGSRMYCLPEGLLTGRIRSTVISPLTLCIGRTLRSCCTLVASDTKRESRAGYVLIGMADSSEPAEERKLHSQKATFEFFTEFLRKAYAMKESVEVEVK